ncbi:hypothetical protein J4218_01075 [Candidatus Pacearchaeota archaeon]|nr:hypothetical protein [Candidatus Pacearchaeota archaeon]
MEARDRLNLIKSLRAYSGDRIQGNRQEAERLAKVLVSLEGPVKVTIDSPIRYVNSSDASLAAGENVGAELSLYDPRFLRETGFDQAYHDFQYSGPRLPRNWENEGGSGFLRVLGEDLDLSAEDWKERTSKVEIARKKLVGYLMELDRKGIAIPNYAGLEKAVDLFRVRLKQLHHLDSDGGRFLECLDREADGRRHFGLFGDLNHGAEPKVSGQVLDVFCIHAPFQVLEKSGLEYRGNFGFAHGHFYLNNVELRLPHEPKFEMAGFEAQFPWRIQSLKKDLGLEDTFSIKGLDVIMGAPDYARINVVFDNSRGSLPPSLVLKESGHPARGFSYNANYSPDFRKREGALAYGTEIADWLMANQVGSAMAAV